MKRRIILMTVTLCILVAALPVIVSADSTASIKLTRLDKKHIAFGSYPQTEIVGKASQSGAYKKSWTEDGDYVVDDALYRKLKKADYNCHGDTTLKGKKYRRIKRSDAVYSGSWGSHYYKWSDYTTYHYFRYDPIIWRVLDDDGNDAFLLAENVIDDQKYNMQFTEIDWNRSTIRSWLNGYDASKNSAGINYSNNNFINTAFNKAEQCAIGTGYRPSVENSKDKITILSESEVCGRIGVSNGFAGSYKAYDNARRTKSSTYAKAMGVRSRLIGSCRGNCSWWLQQADGDKNNTGCVNYDGYIYKSGYCVNNNDCGIRPALRLSLKDVDF